MNGSTLRNPWVMTALFALSVAFVVTSAQYVSAASSLFGGATESGGHVVLVSDASNASATDDYSGVDFDDANGTVFSTLSTLSSDFDVTDDSCGGGSPRFQIAVDTDGDSISDGNAFVYMGPSPSFSGCTGSASTGNLIGNDDAGRWDFTQLGGPLGGYSDAPANVLAGTILGINIVVDGSWSAAATGGDSEQTVNIDNVEINTTSYAFTEAPGTVTVTIDKYVEGAQATVLSAGGASFPMQSTWDADNLGAGSGSYNLDTGNSYEAMTANMTSGADYATNEVLGGDVVGESCLSEGGPAFALSGYTTGDTLVEAQTATPTMTAPSFTDITTNKFVIVWNEDCALEPEEPTTVNVNIIKYVDGQHATAANAASSTFTLIADYDGTVNGDALSGSDPYDIGPVGNNTPNAYEATTLDFDQGADYGTHEVTDGDTVGSSCEAGKPFALTGYTWGNTLEEAQLGTATTTAPSFTNLQSDKYVIVWNEDCAEEPEEPGMVTVTINKFINGMMASSTASSSPSFLMSSTWNAINIGAGTGTYTLSATGYNSPNAYEAITADMTAGADYTTSETLGTNVGASCEEGKPYALSGYKSGNTFAEAVSSTSTTTAPAFTNMQSHKYVIVWNVTCPNGSIGGDVEGDQGTLEVTSIDAVDTSATADDTYENGWEYLFHITVPTNEPGIAMKFTDWTSGSNTIPVANNMRISSVQASSTSPVTVLAADTYTIPDLQMITDLNPSMPGIQVQVKVEVKIPVGTSNASYTTNYGVRSQ